MFQLHCCCEDIDARGWRKDDGARVVAVEPRANATFPSVNWRLPQ
jgi:hypothetical protein